MRFIADFHIHSKFSRATSPEMEIESLSKWAEIKGITLLGTGDFTHPTYLSDLKEKLEPLGNGLFQLKNKKSPVRFILTVELSNIYHQADKLRKIHNIIFAPSFEVVDKINKKLANLGKLEADGRPIFTFSAKDLARLILGISQECLIIPAHAWTPWFSIFGANSGFDSIEECFGEYSKYIYSIETGLSSDPQMNWRLSKLDKITLVSNSDAHSPSKLGREANVFDCELDYKEIAEVIKTKDKSRFIYTVEFFPEEGKYHFDGHRNCGILYSPAETKKNKGLCPVCHRKITIGVMHRVEDLADRPDGFVPPNSIPFKNLIPLQEIIAEALGQAPDTKGVQEEYKRMIQNFGSEFRILLDLSPEELSPSAPPKIVEGLKRMREGKLSIIPGHDGVYGKIKIFEEAEKVELKKDTEQLGLF
ncbi:MAG TPA: endonuclease Q family protein [Terriglobales bacterium]|nr:endonuclease Q family protein [Terriglobales bacterium]